MADYRNNLSQMGTTASRPMEEIDAGLRSYMLRIYNYMALALGVTGVAALGTAAMAVQDGQLTQLGAVLYTSPLRWVVMLAPLAFVMVLSFGIERLSFGTAQAVFWAFAAIMGVSLSSIFLVFTATSITQTFFVTAAAFGALSLYGYTTKRNLSGMGSFLMMGLFGLIIAMLVNLFLQSSAMQFAISVIGVLIFAGLTAWDTQRLKSMYDYVAHDETMMGRTALMGALSLYLNFVNMFMFLLQFMGSRE